MWIDDVKSATGSEFVYDENVINLIEFLYDSNNGLIGFTYDKNTYFYIKNAQGDVTDIVDVEGNVLASYLYYAWGITTIYDNSGIDPTNKLKYVLFHVSKEKGLNGWYLFNYSNSRVIKI